MKEITACRLCGNTDVLTLLDLGNHALSGVFPRSEEKDPLVAPLVLVKCNDELNANACGLVQLRHEVPAGEMYKEGYGYRSGINKIMSEHLKELVKEIKSYTNLLPGDVVLDIGSNDATLLKNYEVPGLKRIGIDPTGEQFKAYYPAEIDLVCDFFNIENFKKISPDKKAKVITSIAMFYDLPDPLAFAKDIRECLDKEGIWLLEQSYMPFMLSTNSFDTVCHEHLEYYALKQIKWIMDKAGFEILDVNFNNINGGSFSIVAAHKESNFKLQTEKINKILETEAKEGFHTGKPYREFRERIEYAKEEILNFLNQEKKNGKSIHIYGASTKGNTLLQYLGIDTRLIDFAADRNPEKDGKVTPGTRILIISEEKSRALKPDYFLVLPWHFKEGFLERESDFLDSGGKFIFPLPKFEVIGKENVLKSSSVQKKVALVTGITGQIGSYLAELLVEKKYEVYGMVRRTSLVNARERIDHINGIKLIYGDLGDSNSIEKVISEVQPDEIYNLGAQSHVWISFHVPEYTADVNSLGVLRICEAAKRLKKKVKIYQASTSELYGGIYNHPVNEDAQFHPKSPYGIAKLYGYWTMRNYREAYNMFCVNGIVFNTESPRRGENFVTRKITKGIADILRGKQKVIRLGNLNAKRDWSHAKDTARGIWMMMQAEKPSDYVIASGETHSIREFVELAFRHVGIEISWKGSGIDEVGYDKQTGRIYVTVDPLYFRPVEVDVLIGDATRIKKDFGWNPEYKFSDIIKEMMEHDLK